MFVQKFALVAAIGALVAVAGCTDDKAVNTATGVVAGAALGSLVGNGAGKTAAMIGGAAVGGVVGSRARN